MKFLYWGGAALVAMLVITFGGQYLASERVEVIDLYTTDLEGEAVITRLWVADDEGYAYLRVGADGSGWFDRLQENVVFRVGRDGEVREYTAVLRPDKSAVINQLMQDKYTWGDSLMAVMVGSREGAVPIELHLADQAPR